MGRQKGSKKERVMSVKEICLVVLKSLLLCHTHHCGVIAGRATSSPLSGSDGAARSAAA